MPPYIGVWPAIQLIVEEMLPGRKAHAKRMTGEWIRFGLFWRGSEPERDSFEIAAEALKEAVLDKRLKMTSGGRLVEDHERGKHRRLNIRDDIPDGRLAFLAPEFCVEDLRRVVPPIIAKLREEQARDFFGPSPPAQKKTEGVYKRKRRLVEEAFEQRGVDVLAPLSKEREAEIIEAVKNRGEIVTPRHVRKRFKAAKDAMERQG
jgi:hypothetical protein